MMLWRELIDFGYNARHRLFTITYKWWIISVLMIHTVLILIVKKTVPKWRDARIARARTETF